MSSKIEEIETKPIEGQKLGTSGLRKKVKIVKETKNYLENFVQSLINALIDLSGSFSSDAKEWNPYLVIGGDGRYFNKEAIQIILQIFFANAKKLLEARFPNEAKVLTVLVAQNGVMSTPAVSAVIRSKKCGFGGIILTASHNPGGPDEDWGIKYNAPNGGPAVESITDLIYHHTTKIKTYFKASNLPKIDLSEIKAHDPFEGVRVEVISSVDTYVNLMKQVFDFNAIKSFIESTKKNFHFIFDAMNGVTGVYARRIFCEELGMNKEESLLNCIPLEDFGGLHPDPNLTYANVLVSKLYNENYDLGAASDGDGDRNMILGKKFFVTPSDSVAIIAEYASKCIPYFSKGLKGLARSMPTSTAIDRVAKGFNISCYEVPTGWKFFGNLMDAEKLSICGEESFGTGSDHIREKDGIFAVLCWLSILAYKNASCGSEKIVSVAQIVQEHWKKYGRSFYTRYDYENVESEKAERVMSRLRDIISSNQISTSHPQFIVNSCDDFSYTDPVDGSISKNQGIRIHFKDGSRVVFRLSGTGSSGATIRLYMEKYIPWIEGDAHNNKFILDGDSKELVKPLFDVANSISQLQQITGRDEPTVIT